MGGRRRRTAPKRTLVGPLVMLLGGGVAGVLLWRALMREPPVAPVHVTASDPLTAGDGQVR